jgi:hypothetical protein
MVQLPGLNTPQFAWCKNHMPNKGQPVPPIYQPEVAARAIVWAAYHRRRELNVGIMSSVVIWGNKFLPALGDWYLAKTGIKSQQYDGTEDPNRPDNLWQPVDKDADCGAHGPFNNRAHARSAWLWMVTRPGHPWLGIAALLLLKLWVLVRVLRFYRR